jgi:hypothetical protein
MPRGRRSSVPGMVKTVEAQRRPRFRSGALQAPGRRAGGPVDRPGKQQQHQHRRRREHQCPGDHFPAADAACHLAGQRIGHGCRERRCREQQVGPVQIAGRVCGEQRIDEHRARSRHPARPKPEGRPLARHECARHGGEQRQHRQHHRSVRGRRVLHGDRHQQRKSDDGERCKCSKPRPFTPQGRLRARPQQRQGRQHRRHQGASRRDEQGIEIGNREPRCRQRQAEDDDAVDTQKQGLAIARGRALGRHGKTLGWLLGQGSSGAERQPRLPPRTLREMTTRMISLVPSRIWCTRRSRTSFSRP